jgi:hypothetical protein
MRQRVLAFVAFGVFVVSPLLPATAQDSREALSTDQQQKKAATAAPEPLNRAEVFFDQLEHGKWFLGVPRGWYPAIGTIYPGGGIAGGVGFRQHIGYDSFVDVSAMYSLTNYKRLAIVGNTPNHIRGRLDLSGSVSWLDATQVPYYGLGRETSRDDRTNFRANRTQVEGAAVLHLVDWLRLRLDGGFDKYTQKSGLGRSPSIETRFSPESAPLLGADPLYLRGEASAAIVWLQSDGYSRRGGLYRLAYEEFNPIGDEGDTFGFVRTEVVQHVPILRETWVLSLRARTESIVRESDVVPYFLMPYLGSGSTLRGYTTGRFRDRHSMLLNGELRWFPNRAALDMAIFVDAGDVAHTRGAFNLNGMKTDYGVGVRFHGPLATVLRVELARGFEGWRTIFASSAPF